jgi:hypothetical protein
MRMRFPHRHTGTHAYACMHPPRTIAVISVNTPRVARAFMREVCSRCVQPAHCACLLRSSAVWLSRACLCVVSGDFLF